MVKLVVPALLILIPVAAHAQAFLPVGDVARDDGQANAGRVVQIAPVPDSQGTVIYVGTSDGGLWRTTNGGANWTPLTDSMTSLRITGLAVDSTGERVFAVTRHPIRLLRSLDHGVTFDELPISQVAFGQDYVSKLLVDPVNAGTVYAVTTRGLLRTQDNGTIWEVVFPPSTVHLTDAAVLAGEEFWVVVTRADEIYRSDSGDPGSFVSVPLGEPTDGQPASYLNNPSLILAPVPGQPERIWIAHGGENDAIYVSDAYGASAAFHARHPQILVKGTFVASRDGNTLYSGDRRTGHVLVNRGTNGGQQWDLHFSGSYHADIWAIATLPSPFPVYVGTDGGLWDLDENLQHWSNLNGDMATLLLYDVYTARSGHNAIVGGTQDNGAIVRRGPVGWVIAGGGDARESFLRSDDTNKGGTFTGGLSYIDNDQVTSFAINAPPPPCPRPPNGSDWAIDPTNPLRVCTTVDQVQCSAVGGRDPWCINTVQFDARNLVIVNQAVAWASTGDGKVFRTVTGMTGFWTDVSGNLPDHGIIDIDAPEKGDPQHALVLAVTETGIAQVWETTNGGFSWAQQGVPPLPNPGSDPGSCLTVPCPDYPESGPYVRTFAVTFPGFQRPEVWYAGTSHGLLESNSRGSTWSPSGIPNVQVNEIDTFQGVVTVGTWGRGVWQRLTDPRLDKSKYLAHDPLWWLHHSPVELTRPWASEIVSLSDDLIQEVRAVGGGGRTFRRGEVAHGTTDFRVTAGQAFLAKSDAEGMLPLTGPDVEVQPLVLAPGWNAVGIASPSISTAGELVADAALNGIAIGAVLDGGRVRSYVPEIGLAPAEDFTIPEAEGVWVYACGEGGIWTPGAGAAGGTSSGAVDPSISGLVECNAAGPATLPGLAAQLASRMPAEILACLPEQTISSGAGTIEVCDTPPSLDTDQRHDNVPCAAQPRSRGCAVTLRVQEILDPGTGELEILFDAEANGTATLADGTRCAVDASVSGATMISEIGQVLDPPVIDLSATDSFATALLMIQSGCDGGGPSDIAVGDLVGSRVEETLAQEVALRVASLAPVCRPEFQLPDLDSDTVIDCDDGCPADPAKSDPALCGCGVIDDGDADMVAICAGDCDDTDPTLWSVPGEAQSLRLTREVASGMTTVSWDAPLDPGGQGLPVYDVLMSSSAGEFGAAATCLESDDGSDTLADASGPASPGEVHYILVRAENPCPIGEPTLGSDSSGQPRVGRSCP